MKRIKYITCSGVWYPSKENLKNSICELVNEYNKAFEGKENIIYTVLYFHNKNEFMPDRIIEKALKLHNEGKRLRVFCIWRYNKNELKIALNHFAIR